MQTLFKDALHRFIFEHAPVRGEFVRLQESFQIIVAQHNYPPSVRRLLGEALAVVALLGAIIKFKGRLTLQFRGKGPVKLLLAQCNNEFEIRGLVKWEGDLSYDELLAALQQDTLVIMLDQAANGNRYQGIVKWKGHSFTEAIENYFKFSEQLPTKLWLSVDETQAVGLLLQVVPAATENAQIQKEIIEPGWGHITKLAAHFNPIKLIYDDYQEVLRELYPTEDIRVFPSSAISFNCTCSRKRGEDAIKLLGKEEAEAELKTNRTIVVTCDFCNKEYVFDRIDVAALFAGDSGTGDTHLH